MVEFIHVHVFNNTTTAIPGINYSCHGLVIIPQAEIPFDLRWFCYPEPIEF